MENSFQILTINSFENYNRNCGCSKDFYIREFSKHLLNNQFLDKPHGHNFYIVLLITKGTGFHFIDTSTYDVFPGALFIIAPGQIHSWRLSEDVDGFIVFFTKEYISSSDKEISPAFSHFCSGIPKSYSRVSGRYYSKLLSVLHEINKYYIEKEEFNDLIIKLYLNILMLEIAKNYNQVECNHSWTYQQNVLKKFEEQIGQKFAEHNSIQQYAEELNLSVKQLQSFCKKFFNKTPGEMIQERLILEAKRLLIHTDLTVVVIADRLNFADSSYFIRYFRRATGKTPETFRSNVKSKLFIT